MLRAKPDDESCPPPPPAPPPSDKLQVATELLRDYEASGLGWFWSADAWGRITYISDVVARQLGKSRTELLGQPFHAQFVFDREDDDQAERTLALLLNAHKTFSSVVVRPADIEEDIWWAVSGRPQFAEGGEFTGYYGNGSDVTESHRSKRAASQLAMFDPLTGLSNRARITRRLERTLTSYAASKRSCAVMMIDLDRFKQVNDTMGHPAGDALLKQVGERLRKVVDKTCEIGRLGGDEFEVVLPDFDDRGVLGEIAKKIISMISQPYSLEEGRCVIGASVGIAISPYDGVDCESLIRSADLALYAAKGGGRGQFRFYSTELHSEAERRREIEHDLRVAIERDQMRLAYQPQLDLANKVIGLEASLLWEHPEFDIVAPEIFLPIAHETNMIGALNDWALRRACEDAAQLPGNVKIAVKVSSGQIGNQKFPALVAQALAKSELAPERLELELPEAIFGIESSAIESSLVSLRMLGVRLVLEGFGQGYSPLARLRGAAFDKLKIAEPFVRGIGGDNRPIVKAIVSLARDLGMKTIAEGVAATDELDVLRELEVDEIQGPIFSKAVGFDEVVEDMATGTWTIEPVGPSRYREDRRTVLRKVGLIHENYRYEVRLKNLSRTGCLVDGLLDVPVGTEFVLDFGNGQLAVAKVKRSAGAQIGLEFELPLVDDGGGLVTRNRVSPYVLAAAGVAPGAPPRGSYPVDPAGNPGAQGSFTQPKFAQIDRV